MNPGGDVTIAADLVRYLRGGVKRELSATLEILAIQLEANVNPNTYYKALARFDDARALFDAVGVTEVPEPGDLTLDLGRWPRLVHRVLELEYDAELTRLQDAAADGFELPFGDIPALGGLVTDIRKRVGAPQRGQSCLERQLARRITRRRGSCLTGTRKGRSGHASSHRMSGKGAPIRAARAGSSFCVLLVAR